MADGDSIAQLAVVVLLLMLAVPALSTAHDYSGTPFAHSESVVVDYNSTTQLSESATGEGYSENITVVDADNGKMLVEGDDYLWNSSSGQITWLDTANTNDGDNATVDYRAYQRTAESSLSWTIISPFFALFGLFAIVSSVRALWQYVAEVWELV